MTRLVIRRLALSVPLVFAVSVVTFLLIGLVPGDAARALLGQHSTEAQYQQLRDQLGLDRPLWMQYWHWVSGAVHGNFGKSLISEQSVAAHLNSRLAPTLSLIVGAMIVSAVVGVALGVAAQRRGVIGRLVDTVALAGLAVPSFWLGLMLIELCAVRAKLFPPTGYVTFGESPSQWLKSLVLPVITLSLPAIAVVAKQTRDAMAEALGRNFTRTLRAAGVSEASIVYRHALKNAGAPIVTVIGLNLVRALGGTVVVESVFAIPGLGGAAVQGTTQHDITLIQGVVVYFTIFVVIVNLLIDLAYAYLDPRVKVA